MKRNINTGALNYYKDIFLKSLKDISDRKKQEIAWVKGDYKQFNTFTEKYEQFISSSAYIIKWNIFTEEQRHNLQTLRDMVINYDDTKQENGKIHPKNDQEIFNDPKWQEIRNFASELYTQLEELSFQ